MKAATMPPCRHQHRQRNHPAYARRRIGQRFPRLIRSLDHVGAGDDIMQGAFSVRKGLYHIADVKNHIRNDFGKIPPGGPAETDALAVCAYHLHSQNTFTEGRLVFAAFLQGRIEPKAKKVQHGPQQIEAGYPQNGVERHFPVLGGLGDFNALPQNQRQANHRRRKGGKDAVQ